MTTNTTFFTHDSPDTVRKVLDFLNDELEVDAMMISPAYAYERAPDQDHFLGVKQTRKLFQRGVRRRAPQALAAEPQPAVPRLPRGQGRLRLHGLGDPQLLAARLAAALLPDGRRLREDLQGARRDRPTGRSTAAARTRAATTAWRTAATSPPPCSRPAARCASRWRAMRARLTLGSGGRMHRPGIGACTDPRAGACTRRHMLYFGRCASWSSTTRSSSPACCSGGCASTASRRTSPAAARRRSCRRGRPRTTRSCST